MPNLIFGTHTLFVNRTRPRSLRRNTIN
jgi:hypothetical protein